METRYASENYDPHYRFNHLTACGYDDGPHYEWNEKFSFDTFQSTIDQCNRSELNDLDESLCCLEIGSWRTMEDLNQFLLCKTSAIRRMILGQDLDEVIGDTGDSLIPLFLPIEVADRCNKLIIDSLSEQGIDMDVPPITPAVQPEYNQKITRSDEAEGQMVYLWRINSINAWQLVDRRIDE